MTPYDIIGDIHGHYDKLTALLTELGYVPLQGIWQHPAGRKVVFLGDFIPGSQNPSRPPSGAPHVRCRPRPRGDGQP
jgi:hypothetical protein